MKKKSKNPLGLLASNLVGEKLARRMQYDDAQELIKSVTLRNGAFRKVAKKRS